MKSTSFVIPGPTYLIPLILHRKVDYYANCFSFLHKISLCTIIKSLMEGNSIKRRGINIYCCHLSACQVICGENVRCGQADCKNHLIDFLKLICLKPCKKAEEMHIQANGLFGDFFLKLNIYKKPCLTQFLVFIKA